MSTTQTTNYASLIGLLILVLNHFNVNIGSDEVTQLVGAIVTAGGILWNFFHRYNKGDITLVGTAK